MKASVDDRVLATLRDIGPGTDTQIHRECRPHSKQAVQHALERLQLAGLVKCTERRGETSWEPTPT